VLLRCLLSPIPNIFAVFFFCFFSSFVCLKSICYSKDILKGTPMQCYCGVCCLPSKIFLLFSSSVFFSFVCLKSICYSKDNTARNRSLFIAFWLSVHVIVTFFFLNFLCYYAHYCLVYIRPYYDETILHQQSLCSLIMCVVYCIL
jgi:hypothetical protein